MRNNPIVCRQTMDVRQKCATMCDGMRWGAMGCDGVRWGAMGCDGVRWGAIGFDGVCNLLNQTRIPLLCIWIVFVPICAKCCRE